MKSSVKNTTAITPESEIQVHFNDLLRPTKMQYSVDIDGNAIFLSDQNCDMNDLEDIKGMAISSTPERSGVEYLFDHTFTVINKNFGTPFDDSMIPVK